MTSLLPLLPEDLRAVALTHPAYADTHAQSYERLEFLGDSVLSYAVSQRIFAQFPEATEGDLSRMRAIVVSRDSCEKVGRALGLGEAMLEHAATKGPAARAIAEQLVEQRNTLAALVESILGAASMAGIKWSVIQSWVDEAFADQLQYAVENLVDPKSRLQEQAAVTGLEISYVEIAEDGPPHDRTFTAAAQVLNGSAKPKGQAEGVGRSKQEAQQQAAAALLIAMEGKWG